MRPYSPVSRLLAGTLAWSLLATSGTPAFARAHHTSQSLTAAKLPPHERALQALNRLTFGPRPGDVARVEAMGVDQWMERQLHPETIDDSALEARLDSYPAMRLSERDLLFRFPAEPLVRAAADGKAPMPSDPVERAIYADRIYAYIERPKKIAAAGAQQAPAPAAMAAAAPSPQASSAPMAAKSFLGTAPAAAPDASIDNPSTSPSIKAREQHLYADLAATSVVNLPPAQRVAKILALPPAELDDFEKSLTGPEKRSLLEGLTPSQRETLLALKDPQRLVGGELVASRLLRDVYSDRQLEAVMTDFWLNHFNVFLHKGPFAPWYLVEYERSAIRPHAMGTFEDLLVATAESPAMLFYLDNQQSIGPHSEAGLRAQGQSGTVPVAAGVQPANPVPAVPAVPTVPAKPRGDAGLNENYARELMELHTLGVDGGYTQQDVTEVAKVFTGWGVLQPNQMAKNGNIGFEFNPRRHEPGPKLVLGATIQAGGMNEGLQVLHMLATSPATAHHVSQQLAVRFVSDKPSPALVASMAATWLRTGGDIREVLRTMIDAPDFWSKETYRAKIKTPEEFVLSAVRATGGDVVRPNQEMDALNQLGMPFFGCQTPNGYAWTSAAWVNAGDLLERINIAISLANNKLGVATDLDGLMAQTIHQPENTLQQLPAREKEEWLADALLSGPPSPQTRAAILRQIAEAASLPGTPAKNAAWEEKHEGPKRYRADLPDGNTPIPPSADAEAATIAGLLLGSPEFQRK